MKKNHLFIIIVALLAGMAIAFGVARQGEAKALQVNEVGSDPSAFSGTVTITGIIGAVSKEDPNMVGLMDLKESQCTSVNCNKIIIPVKCATKTPRVGAEVKVTGSFVKQPTGYTFAAQDVKVVRNHKIGG